MEIAAGPISVDSDRTTLPVLQEDQTLAVNLEENPWRDKTNKNRDPTSNVEQSLQPAPPIEVITETEDMEALEAVRQSWIVIQRVSRHHYRKFPAGKLEIPEEEFRSEKVYQAW